MFVGNIFEVSMNFCVSGYIICLLRKIQGSEVWEKTLTVVVHRVYSGAAGECILFEGVLGAALPQLCYRGVKISEHRSLDRCTSYLLFPSGSCCLRLIINLNQKSTQVLKCINENGVFVSISGILMGL